MDWAHQRRARNFFTHDWCSVPTASATSRYYTQGDFHWCHSTRHGICVPSLGWRTNSKPTKLKDSVLQETWDSPASTTDSIRLSLSGSALQDEIKSCTAVLMLTSSLASFSNYGIFILKVRVPSSSHKKIINIVELCPTVDSTRALERTSEGNPESITLTKFKTRLRTHALTYLMSTVAFFPDDLLCYFFFIINS